MRLKKYLSIALVGIGLLSFSSSLIGNENQEQSNVCYLDILHRIFNEINFDKNEFKQKEEETIKQMEQTF